MQFYLRRQLDKRRMSWSSSFLLFTDCWKYFPEVIQHISINKMQKLKTNFVRCNKYYYIKEADTAAMLHRSTLPHRKNYTWLDGQLYTQTSDRRATYNIDLRGELTCSQSKSSKHFWPVTLYSLFLFQTDLKECLKHFQTDRSLLS